MCPFISLSTYKLCRLALLCQHFIYFNCRDSNPDLPGALSSFQPFGQIIEFKNVQSTDNS